MITLKSESELAIMDRCNTIVLMVLAELGERIDPGVDIADLDAYAEERTRQEGAAPAFKGYQNFPSTLCVSVNEQVVHGIPRPRKLRQGDIVSVDFGVILEQFYGDGAQTFPVGHVAAERQRLIDTTREALRLGIEQLRVGNRTGDVGHTVQTFSESQEYSLVKDFFGHGIGRQLHEKPQLPNYGTAGRGPRIEAGMVLAIEPMLNLGKEKVVIGEDNWTVSTADGKPSAHFERSVAVTPNGPWVLGTGCAPGQISVELPAVLKTAQTGC